MWLLSYAPKFSLKTSGHKKTGHENPVYIEVTEASFLLSLLCSSVIRQLYESDRIPAVYYQYR